MHSGMVDGVCALPSNEKAQWMGRPGLVDWGREAVEELDPWLLRQDFLFVAGFQPDFGDGRTR